MNRPRLVVIQTASLDGRLAISPDKLLLFGDERWKAIDRPGDFNVYEWLKQFHQPQATLEGSGSFIKDAETPAALPLYEGETQGLYADFLPEKIIQRPGHRGWFTAVDGRGRIRWTYKEFPDEAWKGWYPLVLVGYHTPPEYLAYLQREDIPFLVAGNGPVDLRLALEKMKTHLGVNCLLSTAGGRLNGALLRAGLVDEINVEFLPAVIGGSETASLFASPALKPGEMPTRLRLLSAQVQSGDRVWLRYALINEENNDD
jgi:2,5-diamino-6-(ribosylamino)-4(3H)-pyrimidinone 5'-phosphate reductase